MLNLIGFDYWGCNVGDDLSLAGYLLGLNQIGAPSMRFAARTQFDPRYLLARFSEISWHQTDDAGVPQTGPTLWTAAGSTVFQITCGTRQFEVWQRNLPEIEACEYRRLVCVGAEYELATAEKSREALPGYRNLASKFQRISTRDRESADFLTEHLGVGESLVMAAADVANISLAELYPDATPKSEAFGFNLAADTLTEADVSEAMRFLDRQRGNTSFLASDRRQRRRHEVGIYRSFVRPWHRRWWKTRLKIPDMERSSLQDLTAPFAECETVISSRYHGILTAAWAGCKVSALCRSSKIKPLADQLGIPTFFPPFTVSTYEEARRAARTVDRAKLLHLRHEALAGMRFALDSVFPAREENGGNS